MGGCAHHRATPAAAGPNKTEATALEPITTNKDDDLRLFYPDGSVIKGAAALDKMRTDANLNIWLAGNQFFAMQDVVHAFQAQHPNTVVGVVTLPPGKVLAAITKGGWNYEGKDYPFQPDIYGSVNTAHLQTLKKQGKMDSYITYVRNQLALMVAQGNPKHIKGIDDLARPDLKIMLPNPKTEGIMTFYAKKVLIRHGLWEKLTGNKECIGCQVTPQVYFTTVHHREIPAGIKAGAVDVGINWSSEIQFAKGNAPIESVTLPPEDSLVDEVVYLAGVVKSGTHHAAAEDYLAFLKTDAGQDAYAKHGFIKATAQDLVTKPVP